MYLGRYLGDPDPDSFVWAGGAPVVDVPPPPAQDFPFACLYSDGSQEFVSDPSSCPSKPGVDLVEVDDLTQVSPGPPQIPPREPPAIVVNVPIDGAPIDIPPLPLPPPVIPVQFPPAPPATPPPAAPAPDGISWLWWLVGIGALLYSSPRGRRVSR